MSICIVIFTETSADLVSQCCVMQYVDLHVEQVTEIGSLQTDLSTRCEPLYLKLSSCHHILMPGLDLAKDLVFTIYS